MDHFLQNLARSPAFIVDLQKILPEWPIKTSLGWLCKRRLTVSKEETSNPVTWRYSRSGNWRRAVGKTSSDRRLALWRQRDFRGYLWRTLDPIWRVGDEKLKRLKLSICRERIDGFKHRCTRFENPGGVSMRFFPNFGGEGYIRVVKNFGEGAPLGVLFHFY